MSDASKLASFRARRTNLSQMLRIGSLLSGSNSPFENLYINVGGNEVRTIASLSGNLMCYTEFHTDFFDEVEGEGHGIIQPEQFNNLMSIITDDGYVDFELWGKDSDELSPQARLTGDLRATVALKSGSNRFEAVPTGIIEKYNENNNFVKNDGEPLSTTIDTTVEQLNRIVSATKFRSETMAQDEDSYFGIQVKDEELLLDVGEDYDNHITGSLNAEVSGDDLDNRYGEDFEALIDPIGGDVRVFVEHEAPIIVVQDSDGFTSRGLLTPKV